MGNYSTTRTRSTSKTLPLLSFRLQEKLDQDMGNREEITLQMNKLANNLNGAKVENQKLNKYIGEKNLISGIQKSLDEEDNRLLVDEIAFKSQILDEQNKKKGEKEEELNQNKKLRVLKEQNEKLTVRFTSLGNPWSAQSTLRVL